MSDERRGWMAWTAATLVCAILLPYGWAIPSARAALLFLVLLGFAGGVADVLRSRKSRDPYDLRALREIDEQEKRAERELNVPKAEAEFELCPHCGEEFDSRLLICPNCRRHL